VDVGRGQHGPVERAQASFVEAELDSALAVVQLAAYLGVHSKSFSRGDDVVWSLHQTPQKAKGFRVFSIWHRADERRVRLVKA
jgi:hypothetical protein